MKKRLLSLCLAMVFCLGLLPTAALANITEDGTTLTTKSSVNYIDADGTVQTCESAIAVSSLTPNENLEPSAYELKPINGNGWYVVDTSTEITADVLLQGNIYLILQDTCTLTINGSIRYVETGSPNSLTIYGQKNGTGTLSVTRGEGFQYAIQMDGNLTVNGGIVELTKTTEAGAGETQGAYGIQTLGTVNINGGTVNVRSEQPYHEAEGIVAASGINITGGTINLEVRGDSATNGLRTNNDVTIGGDANVTINVTSNQTSPVDGNPGSPRGIFCVAGVSNITIRDRATLNITGNLDGGYSGCNSIQDIVTRGKVTVADTATVNAIVTCGQNIETTFSPEHIETIDVYGNCVAHGITVPQNATMTIQDGASLALRRGSESDIYGKVVGGEDSINQDNTDNGATNPPVIRVRDGAVFPVSAVKECNLMYEITKGLTNLTARSSNTFAAAGGLSASPYEETLIPASGYLLPESIRVTIGGNEFTEHGYDSTTGVFSIEPEDVTGLIVVTASGVPQTFRVTLEPNNGSEPTELTYTYGVGAALPELTRDGYVFAGWYAESDFSGSPVTGIGTSDLGSKSFYAKWDLIEYTAAVDADGLVGATATLDKTEGILASDSVTLTVTPDPGMVFEAAPAVSAEGASAGQVTGSGGAYTCVISGFTSDTTVTVSGTAVEYRYNVEDYYTPPAPKPQPETGDSGGWDEIQDELKGLVNDLNTGDLEPGETVTVEMNGATEVPREVLKEIAGKDITVEFEMVGGVTWAVNGTDIPANIGDLDLGVSTGGSSIPMNVIDNVTGERSTVQLELSHNGSFGATLHLSVDLGRENRGFWANLYYFNETLKQLVFHHACRIEADGKASWPFDHASSYAIVIDDENHDPEVVWNNSFSDVAKSDWFYDEVLWVSQKGLMGAANSAGTRFEPYTPTSRAMIWTILARQDGVDTTKGSTWDQLGREWAVTNGISDGTDPEGTVTREQLAAMLYRYARYKGMDVSAGEDTNILSWPDAFNVSEYAIPAMQWAVATGVIDGKDGLLQPQAPAIRCEAAAMLMRFLSGEKE